MARYAVLDLGRLACLLKTLIKGNVLVEVTLSSSRFTWVICKVFEKINYSYQIIRKSHNRILLVTSQNMSDMTGMKRTE